MFTDYNTLIFDLSQEGHTAYDLPTSEIEEYDLSSDLEGYLVREEPANLPEVSELQLIRHYTALSNRTFGIETGPYPLGSCTMKYNPKINEDIAALPGFANVHPLQPLESMQGAMQVMYEMQETLQEVTEFHSVTLQPKAGAHGELTAILAFKKYFEDKGETQRKYIFIPDSAHGTNPATAAVAGYDIVEFPSDEKGMMDVEAVKAAIEEYGSETVAGVMITNPSTAGVFETYAKDIVELIHEAGGLAYYDGANLNAIMGISSPARMGFDAAHMNLHKTMTGPHGGGGPGSGPIGVTEELAAYLPAPMVVKDGDEYGFENPDKSIGRVAGFYGNFGVNLRAYAYCRAMGAEGLRRVSEDAVLNANYIRAKISDKYDMAFPGYCMNDFTVTLSRQAKEDNVNAKDVGKRMLDFGVHAPTTYFPLHVDECLQFEPTETESKQDLDHIIDVMLTIAEEIENEPETVQKAPHNAPVTRLDEVLASRKPVLTYDPEAIAEQHESFKESNPEIFEQDDQASPQRVNK